MYIQVGRCPLCGSPVYQPETWAGTCPPSLHYVCYCETLIRNGYGLGLSGMAPSKIYKEATVDEPLS